MQNLIAGKQRALWGGAKGTEGERRKHRSEELKMKEGFLLRCTVRSGPRSTQYERGALKMKEEGFPAAHSAEQSGR